MKIRVIIHFGLMTLQTWEENRGAWCNVPVMQFESLPGSQAADLLRQHDENDPDFAKRWREAAQ